MASIRGITTTTGYGQLVLIDGTAHIVGFLESILQPVKIELAGQPSRAESAGPSPTLAANDVKSDPSIANCGASQVASS